MTLRSHFAPSSSEHHEALSEKKKKSLTPFKLVSQAETTRFVCWFYFLFVTSVVVQLDSLVNIFCNTCMQWQI